jgi:hypothetical protein
VFGKYCVDIDVNVFRPMNASEKNEGARGSVQAFEQSKTIVAGNKSFSNYDYVSDMLYIFM